MSARSSRWPGRTLDLLIAVVLVGLVSTGALRWLDVAWYPVVVAQTAGPFVVIGLALLLLVTLLLRRWWLLLPVTVAAVVAGAMVVPSFYAHSSPRATVGLTVMSANLRYGEANPLQVMDAVRAHNVDVLVLLEVTPDAVERLRAEGLADELSEQVGQARPQSYLGTLVFSRFPLKTVNATGDSGLTQPVSLQPEVLVQASTGTVRLKAVHPPPPIAGNIPRWSQGLADLTTWKSQAPESTPLLMAGDFNADVGHPAFRRVADGLDDAQRVAGLGWVRTWPVVGERLPPYVQLDHLLSRGLTVVDAGQVGVQGTDHAMVWASYALP